ncbi:MAG: galactokinase family protein, partial [Bacteroidota bacterium]
MKQRVKKVFTTRFGYSSELVVKAPGRINIIGEHTDYNEGFVLPAAIDYANYFAFAKSSGSTTRLFSADYDLLYEVDKDRVVKTDEKWVNLILGVVHHLSDRIGQFDVVFAGNIPQGAGLSSSAALCCGLGFGLSELFQLNIEKWTIAKMAQRSEHEFGGVKCGIMDQFASVFGMTNHVLELNCKTLEHQAHEFDISGYRFLLLDSGVTHELENSAYNVRRQECQSVINKLKKATYDRISYQDLSVEILDTHKQLFTQDEYKRAKHIVTDNSRVGQMVSFLK